MTEARRLATIDDVLRLPDNVVGEIIAGELYTSPRPTPRHALAESSVIPVYARLGVPFVWLVDPLARAVEGYRLEGETWRVSTHIGDSPFRAEPFEAVELDPSEWWADEPA